MLDSAVISARLRQTDLFLLVIVLAGILLRIVAYAQARPLWHDEAMIALNLFDRSYAGLLAPLKYDQSAPILWLLGTKLVIQLLGQGELALRLIPLLAGLGSVLLFAATARRLLDGPGAALATGLFCLAGPLIYYAAEAKQYSTDILVSTFFLWVVATRAQRLLASWGGIAFLAAAGAVALLLSHTAVFVLFGAGLSLFVHEALARRYRTLVALGLAGLLWLACFAGVTLLATSDSGTLVDAMRKYWAEWFIPPRIFVPSRFIMAVKIMLQGPEGMGFPPAASLALLFFALAGLGEILRLSQRTAVFLILAVLATVAASMARYYPMTGRFLLFLAPGLILAVAAGVALAIRSARELRLPAVAAVGLVLALMGFSTALDFRIPPAFAREELDRSIAAVERAKRPGDLVYVYYGAVPAFQIYGKALIASPEGVVWGRDSRTDWNYMMADIQKLCGRRAWFVWSHPIVRNGIEDIRFVNFLAGKLGRVTEQQTFRDAGVSLLDLSGAERCDAIAIEEPARPWVPSHPGFRPG
jgi:hypothetical protein